MNTRRFSFLIVLCLLHGIGASVSGASFDKEIKEYEQKISEKEKNLNEIQNKLKEMEHMYDQYRSEEKKIKNDLSHTDAQFNEIKKKIGNLTRELARAHEQRIRVQKEIKESAILKQYWQSHLNEDLVSYFTDSLVYTSPSPVDMLQLRYHIAKILQKAGQIKTTDLEIKRSTLSIELLQQSQAILKQNINQTETKKEGLAKQKDIQREEYAILQNKSLQSKEELSKLQGSAEMLQALIGELEKKKQHTQSSKEEAQQANRRMSSAKGTLPWPITGTIVSPFGKTKHPLLDTYIYNNGIEILSDSHVDVRAVAKGTIVFAGMFGGFGNMVIIDHNGGFFTVYGRLEEISLKIGNSVKGYDIIGSVKDTNRVLYFEIREKDNPQDPVAWLKKN